MAKGDTKTNQYLDIAANGSRADLPSNTCCETRTQTLIRGVAERIMDVEDEVEEIKNNPDVVDIVATYADLQNYDTSHLTDKDVIRVLADETHDGQSTYYRYIKSTDSWTFIGTIGDYYTKTQTDELLSEKQDLLTEGDNITIEDESGALVISATDTTYSDFVGTDGTAAGTAGLVPAPATTDAGKVLGAGGTWVTGGPTVVQTAGTSTTDVMSQNAVSSMLFSYPSIQKGIKIGTDSITQEVDGVSIGAYAASYNNGSIAIGSGQNSMSQAAVARHSSIAIGKQSSAAGYSGVAVGGNTVIGSDTVCALVLGNNAKSRTYNGTVALGAYSGDGLTAAGMIDVGSSNTSYGYNSSNYRLLTGLYDPQSAHDAATKGYVDGRILTSAGAPTTSTAGTVGQLLEDTTNGKLYICTDVTGGVYTWEEAGASIPVLTDQEYNALWSNPNPLNTILTTITTGAGV